MADTCRESKTSHVHSRSGSGVLYDCESSSKISHSFADTFEISTVAVMPMNRNVPQGHCQKQS